MLVIAPLFWLKPSSMAPSRFNGVAHATMHKAAQLCHFLCNSHDLFGQPEQSWSLSLWCNTLIDHLEK